MIPAGKVKTLIHRGKGLFEDAFEKASHRPLVLSSPLVLTRACEAAPLCRYCNWRAYRGVIKDSGSATITKDEAISRSLRIRQAGVDYIHFLSGWMKAGLPDYFFDYIAAVKKNSGLKVITDFGAVSKADLIKLKAAGVDCVSCGLETSNSDIFHALKPGDSYAARLKTLHAADELGFKTGTNFIIGIGESEEDIDTSIRLVDELGISLLSITSFVPTPFTETETWGRHAPYFVAAVTAAARILLKDTDITASFGCDNTSVNYAWGIKCGVNVFSVVLRSPLETPALAGDEISNVRAMWHDSKTIDRNTLSSGQ